MGCMAAVMSMTPLHLQLVSEGSMAGTAARDCRASRDPYLDKGKQVRILADAASRIDGVPAWAP
jgi:hypothetical protein